MKAMRRPFTLTSLGLTNRPSPRKTSIPALAREATAGGALLAARIFRTRIITAAKSTCSWPSSAYPNFWPSWASNTARAARRSPKFTHVPPVRLRSITATECPPMVAINAAGSPAGPPPMITKSYMSFGCGGFQSAGWPWAIVSRLAWSNGEMLAVGMVYLLSPDLSSGLMAGGEGRLAPFAATILAPGYDDGPAGGPGGVRDTYVGVPHLGRLFWESGCSSTTR